MDRIAALLTCHNRREKTLACLAALYVARDRNPGLGLRVYLTDDASTDGTADAVRAFDPEIQVIHGLGDLYWNRGMVAAWRAALDSGERYDAFLLLNDDTLIDPEALEVLLRTAETVDTTAIVVGAVRDPQSGELAYGGVRRTSRWHPGRTVRLPVSTEPQDADTFNANCVLVPAGCVERIGTLDPVFRHAMGDFDYGLRAREAGMRVVVAPHTVGACARNEMTGSWRDRNLSMRERLRLLNSPKGLRYREWQEYLRRHGAPLPWLLAAAPLVSVIGGLDEARWR
jgi:GT2 family glycosyltransferase